MKITHADAWCIMLILMMLAVLVYAITHDPIENSRLESASVQSVHYETGGERSVVTEYYADGTQRETTW